MKIAFLGLGVMGAPMAGHLAKAGYDLAVYNRTAQKAVSWSRHHSGRVAETPADAAEGAEFVFACVGNDEDSIAVARAARSALRDGAVYVDHTTTSKNCALAISGLAAEAGAAFIDAPVSGGEAGAVNGQLSAMCGADAAMLARVRPVMETYCKRIVHIGPVGDGQLCKAANQIAIAGVLQGLSEAAHFCKRTGIDPAKVLEAISGGAAQSWQMENRWATMIEGKFDFGFAVDWMRKDLAIAFQEANSAGAHLPVTRLIDGYYAEVQQMGGNRWDTSSLVARLEKPEVG